MYTTIPIPIPVRRMRETIEGTFRMSICRCWRPTPVSRLSLSMSVHLPHHLDLRLPLTIIHQTRPRAQLKHLGRLETRKYNVPIRDKDTLHEPVHAFARHAVFCAVSGRTCCPYFARRMGEGRRVHIDPCHELDILCSVVQAI